jgi:hypothetical protein
LFYFVFAVLGLSLFKSNTQIDRTQIQTNGAFDLPTISAYHGEGLNSKANFEHLGFAFLTLIRCSFGENWDVLAQDLTWYFCDVEQRLWRPDQCQSSFNVVALFFTSFFIIQVFVIMNLAVSVIIDNFAAVVGREYSELAMENVSGFTTLWRARCKFSEQSDRSYITVAEFPQFLVDLGPPLGLRRHGASSLFDTAQFVARLHLLPEDGKLYFRPTLRGVVMRLAAQMNPVTSASANRSLDRSYLGASYITALVPATSSAQKSLDQCMNIEKIPMSPELERQISEHTDKEKSRREFLGFTETNGNEIGVKSAQ